MNEIIKSRWLKIVVFILVFILVILVSFAIGIKIGSHKALFSCVWGENYKRNFMNPKQSFGHPGFASGMMRDFEGRDFRNSHGLSGIVLSISPEKLMIKDDDGKENIVGITDRTIIKKRHSGDFKLGDLKIDDKVVVMGRPNSDGIIDAILIRVFEK